MGYTVFVHSHKFRLINGKMYSPGGLPNDVLARYADWYGNIIVIARIIKERETKKEYSLISNKNVTILNYKEIRKKELGRIIEKSDRVILRFPCNVSCYVHKLAKRYHKIVVSEVVGCAFDSLWNYGIVGKIVSPFMFFKNRRAILNSDYTVYVTKAFLQRRYPTRGVSIWCSDASVCACNEKVREKRIIEKQRKGIDGLVLGTCGAVDVKYKGHEYVIKAIAKLKKEGYKNIIYQIVGGGDSSRLKSIARKYNVAQNVRFLGVVPHNKILEWFDGIDIYIQPSNAEGLSRALLEAMGRGCPCIVSDVGGNSELIEARWVFGKKNVDELCNKILEMVLKKQMARASELNYNKSRDYGDEELSKKRERFYRKVIGK